MAASLIFDSFNFCGMVVPASDNNVSEDACGNGASCNIWVWIFLECIAGENLFYSNLFCNICSVIFFGDRNDIRVCICGKGLFCNICDNEASGDSNDIDMDVYNKRGCSNNTFCNKRLHRT